MKIADVFSLVEIAQNANNSPAMYDLWSKFAVWRSRGLREGHDVQGVFGLTNVRSISYSRSIPDGACLDPLNDSH